MANSELFERIEEMVESDELTLKQGIRLLMGSVLEIHRELKTWKTWQLETNHRLDVLESRDKREIAKYGALGVVAGAVVSGLAMIIVAAM